MPREQEIIALMGEGLGNKEIAWRLKLSEGTVRVYSSRVFDRHPEMKRSRWGAVRVMARDHERQQAIRLDVWIRQHGKSLSPTALAEIREILAEQVAEFLQ